MNIPPLFPILVVLTYALLACQSPSAENKDAQTEQTEHTYEPTTATLRISSDRANAEITRVQLLDDRKQDSLATATPEEGTFTLVVDQLPLHEVYFLKISGQSTRTGTSGLTWAEYVPIYFESSDAELTLSQQPFNHVGSISGVTFSIDEGGEEQQLLNEWQQALNQQLAEEEGKMTHYTLGASGAQKAEGEKEDNTLDESAITRQYLEKQRPVVTSLFLAYTTNDHRKYADEFTALYESVNAAAKETKYGVDLHNRLNRIQKPIKQLIPDEQLVAIDPALQPLSWNGLSDYQYILLSFWNSADEASHSAIKKLDEQAPSLEQQKTAVVHLSMDSRLSNWKEVSEKLDLQRTYKLRNAAQQSLIDSLYLTDLPRYVLIEPNGTVVNADVSVDELPGLLE